MIESGLATFDHEIRSAAAVVLIDLGTPDAPDPSAVRRYLAEFLSDPRVVEWPRWLCWPILHGLVLRFRPRRSAQAYRRIWTELGSPLLNNSEALAAAVAAKLSATAAGPVQVRCAMRDGQPVLDRMLRELRASNLRRLLVLPLFPQYSSTTTGSAFDALANTLSRWRRIPDLVFVSDYHRHPNYLDAIADTVRDHCSIHGRRHLLFSFHGLPERYFHAGDPDHCHCHATARRVADRLGLDQADWTIACQSRVGRKPWLRPYTERRLRLSLAVGFAPSMSSARVSPWTAWKP